MLVFSIGVVWTKGGDSFERMWGLVLDDYGDGFGSLSQWESVGPGRVSET